MKSAWLAAILLVAASGSALAQLPNRAEIMKQMVADPKGSFAAVDTDKNNEISKAEWLAAGRLDQGFKRIDANGDGKIDMTEWLAAIEKIKKGGL